jgi:hypothetical protein
VAFHLEVVHMCMSLAAEVVGDVCTHLSVALALVVRVHILTARVEKVQRMGCVAQVRVGEYSRRSASGPQRSCLARAVRKDLIAAGLAVVEMAALVAVQSALGIVHGRMEGTIVVLRDLAIERMVIDAAVVTQRLEMHMDWAWARC